ncbi:hypothetical protein GCM10010495_64140 [Kitasatospora herbaricolor]|nr:hypothetical protein GCM10010495_64140 [Kitasatospora herbaricolor]
MDPPDQEVQQVAKALASEFAVGPRLGDVAMRRGPWTVRAQLAWSGAFVIAVASDPEGPLG